MSFTLDADDLSSLSDYLRSHQWIAPDEVVQAASKPGEGNMNYVLRIRTNFRSFIIKQSRDYVEKYPQIPAPAARAITEGHFYELIQRNGTLRGYTPEVGYLDPDNHIITLEDLGQSSDFTFVYAAGQVMSSEDLSDLLIFLSVLHRAFQTGKVEPSIQNLAMRQLNAEHIFNYPFLEDNGFDLDEVTPGLQALAMTYKTDAKLKTRVKALSETYLSDGPCLLHGDYYPGSWLKTLAGVKVIDPEFCFFGPAEFDVSVTLAHLIMADQPEALRQQVLEAYQRPAAFDEGLLHQLTGVEVMRRVIGLAQLPLSADLARKEALLAEAYRLLMA